MPSTINESSPMPAMDMVERNLKPIWEKLKLKYLAIGTQALSLLLFLKGGNMAKGVENVIISLYAKGMSNEDIREQLEEIYNFELSSSAISRITDRINDDITT